MTPTSTSRRIAHGFDRLAPLYDALGNLAFGGTLMRSQTAALPYLPHQLPRVLIVGGGTGLFLLRLLQTKTIDQIVYVDLAPEMVRRSRDRIARHRPDALAYIDFRPGTIDMLDRNETFDLICTQCLLDCFDEDELLTFVKRLRHHLTPTGEWLFFDFNTTGGSALGRVLRRNVVRLLYYFFRSTCGITARTLPPVSAAFDAWGFTARWQRDYCGHLFVNRIYRCKHANRAITEVAIG